MAVFQIENESRPFDEITLYQMGRYISSNEAVWRILSFPIHERHPTLKKELLGHRTQPLQRSSFGAKQILLREHCCILKSQNITRGINQPRYFPKGSKVNEYQDMMCAQLMH
jgi:hypothetical protein